MSRNTSNMMTATAVAALVAMTGAGTADEAIARVHEMPADAVEQLIRASQDAADVDAAFARAAEMPTYSRAAIGTVAEDGTEFTVVASTGAERLMYHYPTRQIVREVLTMTSEAIDLSRVAQRAVPFIADHWAYDVRTDTLGRVASMRVENGQLIADVRMSKRASLAELREDIAGGIHNTVSVGYQITGYRIEEGEPGQYPKLVVTSWRVLELSLVAIPADAGAVIRSASTATPGFDLASQIRAAFPAAGAPAEVSAIQTGERMSTPTTTTTAPEAPVVDTRAIDAALAAESARVTEINSIARAHNIEAAEVDAALADRSITADAFGRSVLDRLAARTRTTNIEVTNPGQSPAQRNAAMVEAVVAREMGRQPAAELAGAAREFRGIRLNELVGNVLRQQNISFDSRDADSIFAAAQRSMMVSGDLPELLGGIANKLLLESYGAVSTDYQRVARRRDLVDFKPTKMVTPDDFPDLSEVAEGGEISVGSIGDGAVSVHLKTYGKSMRLSRQMFVNDDLGYFTDLARNAGAAVARLKNRLMFGLIVAEAAKIKAGQTSVLFVTGADGNVIGDPLAEAGLSNARKIARKRKNRSGNTLDVELKTLLTGPDLETVAEKLIGPITATESGNYNPFAGKLAQMVAGAIEDDDYFLLADPNLVPSLAYGHLNGNEAPMVSQQPIPGHDGVSWDILVDFHASAVSSFGIVGKID